MADVQVKRKIGVSPRARITNYPSRPSSPTKSTRLSSPSRRSQMRVAASSSDPSRPRAKVSSSANVAVGKRPAGNLTPGYGSGTSTPRAPSPVKQHELQQGRLSPKPHASTLSRMRSKAALSAASAPCSPRVGSTKSAYATLSAATSDSALAKPSPPRVRQASISSMSQLSSASSAVVNGVRSPALSVVSYSQDSDTRSNVSTQHIKAKVTGLAKGKPPAHAQPFPSPLLIPSPTLRPSTSNGVSSPSSQIHQRIGRTASIGSLSAPRSALIYPITTASPTADVHRFATVRTPSATHRPPQSFTSPLQSVHKPLYADPTPVPLPPLSPPVSNLSFSSRSSASRSSMSLANNFAAPSFSLSMNDSFEGSADHNGVNGHNARSKSRSNSVVILDVDSDHDRHGDSSEPDVDGTGEERTLKAEAKSHRKIADLEITTKSLLVINTQLEANKHKQAKEIRDLRRKLRESQLALPPRAYRELKASTSVEDLEKEEEEPDEPEEEGDDEARMSVEAIKLGKDDESFDRVRLIIDSLLETGRQALASKAEDFAPPKGAAKVLHEVEARTWRDGVLEGDSGALTPAGGDAADDISFDESFLSADSGDEATSLRRVSDESQDFDNSTRSEREVEELVGNLRSSLSASLRPGLT